jgi:hypothetical protein
MASGILQRRTIDQILSVLKLFRDDYNAGHSLRDACHTAIRKTADRSSVTYQTIEDGCRRRLGLQVVDEFHELLDKWMKGNPSPLKQALMRVSSSSDHHLITSFFVSPTHEKPTDPLPQNPPLRQITPLVSESTNQADSETFTFRIPSVKARLVKAIAEIEGQSVGAWLAQAISENVTNKWRDRITRELKNLSQEERIKIVQELEKR